MTSQGHSFMQNSYAPSYSTSPLSTTPPRSFSFPPPSPATYAKQSSAMPAYFESQPKLCGNCGSASPCALFCNSCAINVCNNCMAAGETCCVACDSLFPVYKSRPHIKNIGLVAQTSKAIENMCNELKSEGSAWSESTTDGSWSKGQQLIAPETPSSARTCSPSEQASRWSDFESEQPMSRQMSDASRWADTEEDETTLMLYNLPCRLEHSDVVAAIKDVGFADMHEFVHVPESRRNNKRSGNMGYAFVHFNCPESAALFSDAFQNYKFQHTSSTKSVSVKPAHIQGFNGRFTMPDGKVRPAHRRIMTQGVGKIEGTKPEITTGQLT